jgi:UDP:flavonoid glycosyltransferase YjiC (YdhE family)
VIGEWLISPVSLDLWQGVKRLKGFPLSRYFNAFDFSISAAGYNSYNEIMSFELPSVFIANEHASMDDQYGRARFAQDNDAAFHLPEHAHQAIGGLITPLLNPEIRKMIKQNCRKLARKNGAKAAAAAITRLHYGSDRRTPRKKTSLPPTHQKWNDSRCLQALLS